MEYQILNVSRNNLDEQSLTISLNLQPTRWERWFKKIPSGKNTFLGYGQRWYSDKDFHPAPGVITKILFAISYDRSYRHLQQTAKRTKRPSKKPL